MTCPHRCSLGSVSTVYADLQVFRPTSERIHLPTHLATGSFLGSAEQKKKSNTKPDKPTAVARVSTHCAQQMSRQRGRFTRLLKRLKHALEQRTAQTTRSILWRVTLTSRGVNVQ
ncbi:hypothetical protein M404DRAFT_357687 [Pisolithus tinctorius Marx 270]|uniref:Uncharacterized protein n=1 Tax=Pisolithus tinctorius Marx 270 TaxID=870435 RepID=A0A0C3JHA5_PISTI|nr:hypothetical protein M404DRAFT_357687 [Pisolithus tinctorius Marx 270]